MRSEENTSIRAIEITGKGGIVATLSSEKYIFRLYSLLKVTSFSLKPKTFFNFQQKFIWNSNSRNILIKVWTKEGIQHQIEESFHIFVEFEHFQNELIADSIAFSVCGHFVSSKQTIFSNERRERG